MKNIKNFEQFVNEKWGDTHQSPSENVEPIGYNIGDIYCYTDNNYSDLDYKNIGDVKFRIDKIENGVVYSVSIDNKHQDNPSTLELNDYIKNGKVVLIEK